MAAASMITVSWAWMAAWVFLGAVITVLACIMLSELTRRPHARKPTAHHAAPRAHEQTSPDETSHEHLPHAA